MPRVATLALSALAVTLLAAAKSGTKPSISEKNWNSHPDVVAAREIYTDVKARIADGSIALQTTKTGECDPSAWDLAFLTVNSEGTESRGHWHALARTVARAPSGAIRMISQQVGAGPTVEEAYYDTSGQLRFFFVDYGDGSSVRIYIRDGKQVWGFMSSKQRGRNVTWFGDDWFSDYLDPKLLAATPLPCEGMPPPSPTATPFVATLWQGSPEVKDIRALYADLRKGFDDGTLTRKTREFEGCPAWEETKRILAADAAGRPRVYVTQRGAETIESYYDEKATLRFFFVSGADASGTAVERRIYRDANGRRLWEEDSPADKKAKLDDARRIWPKRWPESALVLDPRAAFDVPSDCDRELHAAKSAAASSAPKPLTKKAAIAAAKAVMKEADDGWSADAFTQKIRYLNNVGGDDCEQERYLFVDTAGRPRLYSKGFDCSGDSAETDYYFYDTRGTLRAVRIGYGSVSGGKGHAEFYFDENGHEIARGPASGRPLSLPDHLVRSPAKNYAWPVARDTTEHETPPRRKLGAPAPGQGP